jgi:hypothetical protein
VDFFDLSNVYEDSQIECLIADLRKQSVEIHIITRAGCCLNHHTLQGSKGADLTAFTAVTCSTPGAKRSS